MKVLKKVGILILISIIIQASVLLYLEKYYFANNTVVQSADNANIKLAKIKVSENTKEFKVSFDGKYLSYIDSNQLNVIDTKVGKLNVVKIEEAASVSFYKWLPESNKIIYASRTTNEKGVLINFYYYNPINNTSEAVRGQNLNNSVQIQEKSISSQVTDISIGTSLNAIYVKISKPGKKIAIYDLKNMDTANKAKIESMGIGEIQITSNDDKLYYEDLLSKKIKTLNGNVINNIDIKEPSLLGTDNNGNIYIGDVKNGTIKKIYWSIIQGKEAKWNSKEFSTELQLENLFITPSGKIYVNDNLKGYVTELNSGIQTEYVGNLQSMYNNGIASINEGILVMTKFK